MSDIMQVRQFSLTSKQHCAKGVKELEEKVAEQEATLREQADYIALITSQHPEIVACIERESVYA
jgi:phosphate uptake regulator